MRTSELTGAALDWAVCKCEGEQPSRHTKYSTDWAVGGPIIEREGINLTDGWGAYTENIRNLQHGPTPLIAAMRCFVASKLGDEVEIPNELTGDNK